MASSASSSYFSPYAQSGRNQGYVKYGAALASNVGRTLIDLLPLDITDKNQSTDYLNNTHEAETVRRWNTSSISNAGVLATKIASARGAYKINSKTACEDSREFLDKMVNSITLHRVSQSRPVRVVGIAHSTGENANNAIDTINLALYHLYGCDYVFRDVNHDDAFAFLKGKKFTAIVKGNSFGDGVRPDVDLVIVTDDCDLYQQCAARQVWWRKTAVTRFHAVKHGFRARKGKCETVTPAHPNSDILYKALRAQMAVPDSGDRLRVLADSIFADCELKKISPGGPKFYFINSKGSVLSNEPCVTSTTLHQFQVSAGLDAWVFFCQGAVSHRFRCWLEGATEKEEGVELLSKDVDAAWPAVQLYPNKVVKVHPQHYVKLSAQIYKDTCEALIQWLVDALEKIRLPATTPADPASCEESERIDRDVITPMKCFLEYIKKLKTPVDTECLRAITDKFAVWKLVVALTMAYRKDVMGQREVLKFGGAYQAYLESIYCVLQKLVVPMAIEVAHRLHLYERALRLHTMKLTADCNTGGPAHLRSDRVTAFVLHVSLRTRDPLLFPEQDSMLISPERLEKYLAEGDSQMARDCRRYVQLRKKIEASDHSSFRSSLTRHMGAQVAALERAMNDMASEGHLTSAQAAIITAQAAKALEDPVRALASPLDLVSAVIEHHEAHYAATVAHANRLAKMARSLYTQSVELLESLGTPSVFMNLAMNRTQDAMKIMPALSLVMAAHNGGEIGEFLNEVPEAGCGESFMQRLDTLRKEMREPSGLGGRNPTFMDEDTVMMGLDGKAYVMSHGANGMPTYMPIGKIPE